MPPTPDFSPAPGSSDRALNPQPEAVCHDRGLRVLFLDIDGVLAAVRSCVGLGGWPHDLTASHIAQFDGIALGLIRRLCRAADAKVVLSSSWRIMHDWQDVGRALSLPIIDATPRIVGSRGQEIARWLQSNPDVTSFAIVDDDSDMLPEQKPFFVKTDGQEGLLWRDYVKLCELFSVSPYDGRENVPKLDSHLAAAGCLDWSES